MAKIRYTKTFFQVPEKISEDAFYSLKNELSRNPNFEIAKGETFTEHYKGAFNVMGISVLVVIALSVIGIKDGNPLMLLMGIAVIAILINIFNLFLEAPSFATYVKKRDEYFSRMKYAIINSNNYSEFVKIFY
jgi:hypothetical protein